MSTSNTSTVHDDVLFAMLKECKTLPVFLDHIFGFLNRRTDFYHIANEPNSPVGLPPGFAERIVKQSFFKSKPQVQIKADDKTEINVNQSIPIAQEVEITEERPVNAVDTVEPKFTSSDCYNGAIYDNYTWSQNLLEIDVIIKIPESTTWRDLDVEIQSDRICIKLKKTQEILLGGELCHKCKHNDAIWSVNNRKLEIHLDKCKEVWWDRFLKSEPKLDLEKLDCSRPYEELPDEAQAKINELQWNQERKRLGLPTSDEIGMQNVLREAWNAEGSPFSGPFDPSAVKFD